MRVSILASRSSPHQNAHALALMAGLERHGISSQIVNSASEACVDDIIACWGWRNGKNFADVGKRVLVMERGYMDDRFSWTSLGWDGLNGRAKMPSISEASRFKKNFQHLMKDRKTGGEYVLVIGQVPRDAALAGRDLSQWYLETSERCKRVYGLPTFFRAHPLAPYGSYPFGLAELKGDLVTQLAGAAAVITFNSNTAVEAVLAGLDTVAIDEGSMAWEVTGHALGEAYQGDRQAWANQMAWKQWRMEEIEDGFALEHLLEVM
jgi:hypothetical protein